MTDEEKLNSLGFFYSNNAKSGIEGYFHGDEVINMDSRGFQYVYAFDDPIAGSGLTLKEMVQDAKKSLKRIYKRQMSNLNILEMKIDSIE